MEDGSSRRLRQKHAAKNGRQKTKPDDGGSISLEILPLEQSAFHSPLPSCYSGVAKRISAWVNVVEFSFQKAFSIF
jgi:hypothetical protein